MLYLNLSLPKSNTHHNMQETLQGVYNSLNADYPENGLEALAQVSQFSIVKQALPLAPSWHVCKIPKRGGRAWK